MGRRALTHLQAGGVHHKLAGGLVVHGHRLQAAHKGAVPQLGLGVGADDLRAGRAAAAHVVGKRGHGAAWWQWVQGPCGR